MTEINLQDIKWLLDGITDEKSIKAASLRNGVEPDWVEDFFINYANLTSVDSSFASGHPINAATGQAHTVESMVEELKQRVCLDQISKTASVIPLYKKAMEPDQQILNDMSNYIQTYHLKPAHGYPGSEVLFDTIKDKFGMETVMSIGRDRIMEMIDKTKETFKEPNIAEGLPKYDGKPISIKQENDGKLDQLDFGSNATG